MAKSVRASVSKRNRANLRKKVFGPVVDARTERLAAKLQELASQPRPKVEKSETEMETDATGMQRVHKTKQLLVNTVLTLDSSQPKFRCRGHPSRHR